MWICLTPDDVNLDHLVKAVSASFFHKSINFLVVLNNYLAGGRYFETMKMLCFSLKFYPLIRASFCGFVTVINIVLVVTFYFPSSFYIY